MKGASLLPIYTLAAKTESDVASNNSYKTRGALSKMLGPSETSG